MSVFLSPYKLTKAQQAGQGRSFVFFSRHVQASASLDRVEPVPDERCGLQASTVFRRRHRAQEVLREEDGFAEEGLQGDLLSSDRLKIFNRFQANSLKKSSVCNRHCSLFSALPVKAIYHSDSSSNLEI